MFQVFEMLSNGMCLYPLPWLPVIWRFQKPYGCLATLGEFSKWVFGRLWICGWRVNSVQYHNDDVIMTPMAPQITRLAVVYSIVYSGVDKKKHQSSASLAFVRGIHRDRWIPRSKGQLRGKCFHLMTSSCIEQFVLEIRWRLRISDAEPSSNFEYKVCHKIRMLFPSAKIGYHENSFVELTKCNETPSFSAAIVLVDHCRNLPA